MNIGVVIKEVRKQKGLTQLDLSDHANISVRTIQRIEKDEVEPSFYSLKRLSDILEVDLLEIKNRNSMSLTSKILGIHINDFVMKQDEKTNIEERLNKIESHLSSIAKSRRKQLKIRGGIMIVVGSLFVAFLIIELMAEFGLFG